MWLLQRISSVTIWCNPPKGYNKNFYARFITNPSRIVLIDDSDANIQTANAGNYSPLHIAI